MANSAGCNLRVGHINAQSLEAHLPDVLAILSDNRVHVLAISESWLKPERHTKPLTPSNYTLLRNDRIVKRGGGVALYIHESIKAKVIAHSQQPDPFCRRPEFLFVLLTANGAKILVGVVYNPPKSGYWSDVEDALLNCNCAQDYTILLGDFNINWDIASTPRNILGKFFLASNLEPLPFHGTHHADTGDSTIDYICVSDPALVSSSWQRLGPGISRHDILFADLALCIPTRTSGQITSRNFRNFVPERYLSDLTNIDWSCISGLNDVNLKVERFTRIITDIYDAHAPLRSFIPRNKKSPWYSRELRNLTSARNRAWSAYRRFGRASDLEMYRRLRNRVKTSTRNAKSSYYRSRFSNAAGGAEMWRLVDQLGMRSRCKEAVTLPASVDDMNAYFVGDNCAIKLHDLRPTARISPDHQFYFRHVSVSDIEEAVRSARSNACGPDNISMSCIKSSLPIILPILINIFDCSLQSGVFPTSWKRANVRPIPKKKQPTEIGHFRPISLLCTASKLLEFVALKQISEFITKNKLLDPLQSGFRRRHSTHTALIKIVDDIRGAIDREEVVLFVCIDFSRAFDLVNINLLVDKLRPLGYSDSACSWVLSFLSDRTQVVVGPEGERSAPITRCTGVPQGTLNGPPFFSLYENDAPSALRHCKYHLYADDFTIYISGDYKDICSIVDRVNDDLKSIASWAVANGLSINANKTQAIWFGARSFVARIRTLNPPKISINNQDINYEESVKLLGVVLDSTTTYFSLIDFFLLYCDCCFSAFVFCFVLFF